MSYREKLVELQQVRHEAADKLAAAKATAERAHRLVRQAQSTIDKLVAAEQRDTEHLAGQIRNWAKTGEGQRPSLQADATRAAARIAAQGELAGAEQAHIACYADVQAAESELAETQEAIEVVVTDILKEEGEALVERVLAAEAYAIGLRQQLADLHGIHEPFGPGGLRPRFSTAKIYSALNTPPRNDVYAPGPGVAKWHSYRTRLLDDADAQFEEPTAEVEQAA